MKENGINKLIELLNESEDGFVSKFVSYDGINRVFRLDNGQCFHYTLIISKEYCFIKRLVENNKIDFTKYCIVEFGYYGTEGHCDKYDNILMNLSIQDNPIEFLISILK